MIVQPYLPLILMLALALALMLALVLMLWHLMPCMCDT